MKLGILDSTLTSCGTEVCDIILDKEQQLSVPDKGLVKHPPCSVRMINSETQSS